jgi:hypothetical protein
LRDYSVNFSGFQIVMSIVRNPKVTFPLASLLTRARNVATFFPAGIPSHRIAAMLMLAL